MACNWLRMTSSGDDIWPSGRAGLLTDKRTKNKPKAEQEPRSYKLLHALRDDVYIHTTDCSLHFVLTVC